MAAPYEHPADYVPVADDIMAEQDRALIEYRSEIYAGVARALLKVKTQRDLFNIIQALELGAML